MRINKKLLKELEEEGVINYEISYRGGTYGGLTEKILPVIGVSKDYASLLPRKLGAYVNYLGGGIRGSICVSSYSEELPARIGKKIDKFLKLCRKRYEEIENEAGLNNEIDEDGEINWEARATKSVRMRGITSYPGL